MTDLYIVLGICFPGGLSEKQTTCKTLIGQMGPDAWKWAESAAYTYYRQLGGRYILKKNSVWKTWIMHIYLHVL